MLIFVRSSVRPSLVCPKLLIFLAQTHFKSNQTASYRRSLKYFVLFGCLSSISIFLGLS